MTSRLKFLPLIAAAATLSACATPREQCISRANADYRNVETAIATAQGNIARGYALHTQTVPYMVTSTCYRNDPYRNIVLPIRARRRSIAPKPHRLRLMSPRNVASWRITKRFSRN